MTMSDVTVVTASSIVTIALPQCTIATLPNSCHIQMFVSQQTSLRLVMPLTWFRPVGLGVSRVVYVLLISLEFPNSEVIWQYGNIYFRYGQSYDWSFHHINSIMVLTSFP